MNVTHHSNYIKYMEEARIDYLEQYGLGYEKLEQDGVISFVVSVNVSYKKPSTFGDTLKIFVKSKIYNGVRYEIEYKMINAKTDELVCEAVSTHCFADVFGKICSLKKTYPEYHQLFEKILQDDNKGE